MLLQVQFLGGIERMHLIQLGHSTLQLHISDIVHTHSRADASDKGDTLLAMTVLYGIQQALDKHNKREGEE